MGNKQIKVLITAVGGVGFGEQILKALLLAQHGQYRIIVGDMNSRCPQFGLADQAITLPSSEDSSYIDVLLGICERLEVQALFCGCENELKSVSSNRERFTEAGIFLPLNPPEVIEICMNKDTTSAFLSRHGFDPPLTVLIERTEDLDQVDFFPVVLKPAAVAGGSRNAFVAQTPDELKLIFEYLQTKDGAFVAQEYVGTPDQEYTVGVLCDMDGNFINSIATNRELHNNLTTRSVVPNLSGRHSLGDKLVISSGFSQGIVGCFPQVTEPSERIASALAVRGCVNIQCRLVDGRIKVFEINPRFSGTTSLRAMMGYNEPDILMRRHLMGEAIEIRFPYKSGHIVRHLAESILPDQTAPNWNDIMK
jgi:carbamoyl-phosphate synthase large subunit